jgi:hypothetical protein
MATYVNNSVDGELLDFEYPVVDKTVKAKIVDADRYVKTYSTFRSTLMINDLLPAKK